MRQNKLILKGFEQHFILLSFLTVASALVLLIILVMGVIWLLDPSLFGNATLNDAVAVGAITFALLAVTYYYTLRVDHRVSGPVFVLMRNLDRLGEGDLTAEMRLRHQDHLQEIRDAFNRNIGQLRDQIDTVKHRVAELDQALPQDSALRSQLSQLQDELDNIKTHG